MSSLNTQQMRSKLVEMALDVSVIIPAYNGEDVLERSIASIESQTIPPKEIVVVDDGSTDGTIAKLQKLAQQERCVPIHFYQQENAGAGAARNLAADHVTSRFIAFLDADDEWAPTKLEKTLEAQMKSGASMVCHDIILQNKEGVKTRLHCAARFRKWEDPHYGMFLKNFTAISAMLVETELFKRAGGFDSSNRYSLDFDCWNAMLMQEGATLFVFDDPLVTYHIMDGALSSNIIGRLKCSDLYVKRYVRAVARKAGVSVFYLTFYKMLLIHYEALTMAYVRQLYTQMLLVLLLLPIHLLKMSYFLMCCPKLERKIYLFKATA